MRFLVFCSVSVSLLAGPVQRSGAAPHAPGLQIYTYRRSYTLDEPVEVRISSRNVQSVKLTARRLDLGALLPYLDEHNDLGSLVHAAAAGSMPVQAGWAYALKKLYPDNWSEGTSRAPRLPAGAYLLQAEAQGVRASTWLIRTDYALTATRSRDELLLMASDARSGRPAPDLQLALNAVGGGARTVVTDRNGLWRGACDARTALRVYGTRNGHPLLLVTRAPAAPEPYRAYTFTDRPIYRPGHTVRYKTILRDVRPGPGALQFAVAAGRKATLEVRDPTDALIQRREVVTNEHGSVSGELQLASEPALGQWQLIVCVGAWRGYAGFEVQAYRKPEYTAQVLFGVPHAVGGATVPVTISARYFFGQPVAEAEVGYSVSFAGDGPTEGAYNGRGVTDARGELRLQVRTKRLPTDRTLNVTATVTDLSRRSQSAAGTARITAGSFTVALTPDRAVYRPGDKAVVAVRTMDHDGKPVSVPVTVRLVETLYDEQRRPYKRTDKRQVTTDSAGKGSATFTLVRPGYMSLEAEAFDAEDNKIAAEASLWSAGGDCDGYEYPTLDLVSDRETYKPGETATLLLNTSLIAPEGRRQRETPDKPIRREAWALVTVAGERLYSVQTVHLTGRTTMVRVPLEERHFPGVRVTATLVLDRQIVSGSLDLAVPLERKKLAVTVRSDRPSYAPGAPAAYTVEVRDHQGRPVATEVALGLVDSAVYAVAPDGTPDAHDFFYPAQETRVATDFSFSARYSGGAFQAMPKGRSRDQAGAAGEGVPAIRVRRNFADTAYWNAFVETGADGTATARLEMPDNLTTWRATCRAVTDATAVGSATQEAVSTLPLLVRPELPRFWVNGDHAILSAVVRNDTPQARDVKVTVQAEGLRLPDAASRTMSLAPGGQGRLDLPVTVDVPGGSGQALVRITADAGNGLGDAAENAVPVLAAGLKMVDARAGALTGSGQAAQIDLSTLAPGSTISLTLAPSVASALYDALDYLATYPYGCAEQTTSAFLPEIAAARAAREAQGRRAPHPDMAGWVNLSLQKLYRYQHQDGGWNWWEFDETDGDITAYVLTGLIEARSAGILVDEPRITRGAECLLRLLANERELSRRTDWVLALATIRSDRVRQAADDLYAKRDRLDTYARASLTMALHRLGGASAAKAATLAGEVAEAAHVAGTSAHWPADEGGFSWRSDDITVSARALRALLAVRPGDPRVLPAVRWLMSNRRGKAWETTRASAEAALALAEYLGHSGEMRPDYTASADVDGVTVASLDARTGGPFAPAAAVTLTPGQLRGKSWLTVRMSGAGALYWTALMTHTLPAEMARPFARGVTVRRTYGVTAEDPSLAGTVPSGADITVVTELEADANYRYVIVEDPIPSGCEVAPPTTSDGRFNMPAFIDGERMRQAFVRQEVRDDKVVFFLNDLPKGRTRLTYRIHTEAPGLCRVLPAAASLVYFPEVRGNSGLVQTHVRDRE
ncbi:MAG: MG2 domain-containing protein [Armatimonadetes bacterium]|nr:MG2 domain-containing protein [Armatimonadota bacterium]